MARLSKSICWACGESVTVVPEVEERERDDDAVVGTEFPKKYDRICVSRTFFIKAASRSTQPPDFANLTTDIRSSFPVLEDDAVGLLS